MLSANSGSIFSITDLLESFAEMAQTSAEYQGHGWGCSWLEAGRWRHYHNIRPIWEDDLRQFGETTLLLAHARSAFRDEGIIVENNMPFSDGESVFIFNGELRGVRIRSEGRIGAEKIYNYIRRFDRGDKLAALERATSIILKQSTYVRAMNIILSDGSETWLSTHYNENPEYFQMHEKHEGDLKLVCSHPYANSTGWTRIDNRTTVVL